jgi:Holliday junction resolvase RusA-like endonuclease
MSESAFTRFLITPVPKPRQTQADKWKKRPAVMRYRAFADELRLKVRVRDVPLPYHVVFVLPMPGSWSAKKKRLMNLQPHIVKPDKDNLEKAFLDALFPDDSHVWDGRASKLWGQKGEIWVRSIPSDWGQPRDLDVLDAVQLEQLAKIRAMLAEVK